MDFMTELNEVLDNFLLEGELLEVCPYGEGHINQTFLVTTSSKRYILQRMNTRVFSNPDNLMKNICFVTEHLKAKGIETLNVVPTKHQTSFLKIQKNGKEECFRVYDFIEHSVTFQTAESEEVFYNSGKAFGEFQNYLSEFNAALLTETIPDFHNTLKRFNDFLTAVKMDTCGRVKECQKEIDFIIRRKDTLSVVVEGLKDGSIPLRVTHNDTKLNNILMDAETHQARAVIDLDTIMPGSMLYDFGDSIRFGASTAKEDETDLDKVHFDISLFEVYSKGFCTALKNSITKKEAELLPYGAYLLTLECGMRFLTDYLLGDVYFGIRYATHNLVRCRTQLKLVSEIELQLEKMKEIIFKILN